jgi:hypothetical protein
MRKTRELLKGRWFDENLVAPGQPGEIRGAFGRSPDRFLYQKFSSIHLELRKGPIQLFVLFQLFLTT